MTESAKKKKTDPSGLTRELGCDGERAYENDAVNQPPAKYSLVCKTHGVIRTMHRNTKMRRSCTRCSPIFDTRFLLTLVEN